MVLLCPPPPSSVELVIGLMCSHEVRVLVEVSWQSRGAPFPPIPTSKYTNSMAMAIMFAADKPDQESETWLSWVRLRQRRGTQLGSTIYLVRGNNSGKAAWHYVDVKDSLITEFREKTRGGFLDVADYGEVLISGWGEDPPQDVVDIIARDWG